MFCCSPYMIPMLMMCFSNIDFLIAVRARHHNWCGINSLLLCRCYRSITVWTLYIHIRHSFSCFLSLSPYRMTPNPLSTRTLKPTAPKRSNAIPNEPISEATHNAIAPKQSTQTIRDARIVAPELGGFE